MKKILLLFVFYSSVINSSIKWAQNKQELPSIDTITVESTKTISLEFEYPSTVDMIEEEKLEIIDPVELKSFSAQIPNFNISGLGKKSIPKFIRLFKANKLTGLHI